MARIMPLFCNQVRFFISWTLAFGLVLSCSPQRILGFSEKPQKKDDTKAPVKNSDTPIGVARTGHADNGAAKVTFASVPPESQFDWKPEWNAYIVEALEKSNSSLLDNAIVPKEEMTGLCPGFFGSTDSEKTAFWALFIASFARYESGFDPGSRMQEDSTLGYAYSEGLLQLSYGDEKNYTHCNLNIVKNNILDPRTNLQCGVEILSAQIATRRSLFTGDFFYWSVLSKKKTQITKDIKKGVEHLTFCKKT